MARDLTKTWTAQNEAPVGYEPVYSVVETKTGRDIATNLDRQEAHVVAAAPELHEITKGTREMLEELYLHYRYDNPAFLKEVNMMIARMDIILNQIQRGK